MDSTLLWLVAILVLIAAVLWFFWDKIGESIRETIGALWGKTTTLVLSIGVAILPVLQTIDPAMLQANPRLKWIIVIVGIVVAVLRIVAPPPPAVVIKKDDAVSVNRDAGTVTIAKAADIPKGITDKAAGEKM